MKAHDADRTFAARLVRCRRCPQCLRARTAYWALAAVNQTKLAAGRTWFGTLTFGPEFQAELLKRAMAKPQSSQPDWFATERRSYFCRRRQCVVEVDAWVCDARFSAVRDEAKREVQKFWKRLRKAGHRFRYLVVFEQHKSGDPHVHFLLHEEGDRILKRELESKWGMGFSKFKLVGGRRSAQVGSAERAAWYVAKYLSKSAQARQMASENYVPE